MAKSKKVSKAHQELNSHAIPELGWNKGVIVLTDSTHYPRGKHIEANYGGMSTPALHALWKQLFHTMMTGAVKECMGWAVNAEYKDVRKELERRGEEVSYGD